MFLDIVMGRKKPVNLALSAPAIACLDKLAEHTALSRVEVIEAIAAGTLTLIGSQPTWTLQLTGEGEAMTLTPVGDSTATAPPVADSSAVAPPAAAPPAVPPVTAPPPAPTADLAPLQREIDRLRSQLRESQAHIQQLEAQWQTRPPQSSVAAPSPTIAQYQAEIATLKMAYAQLEQQQQQQAIAQQHLQQALAQARQMATIGETRLNKWQYKTFSR